MVVVWEAPENEGQIKLFKLVRKSLTKITFKGYADQHLKMRNTKIHLIFGKVRTSN